MNIQAVPLTYKGIKFRSSLEADWAATFDELDIYWQYEPMGLLLPSGQRYLPDFFLPSINTWAEVKGPHWERFDKAVELRQTLAVGGAGWWEQVHVIVLEAAGPGDAASWRVPDSDRVVWLTDCGSRDGLWTWLERDGRCWRCHQKDCGGQHNLYWPAAVAVENAVMRPVWRMRRAPRPEIVGAKGGK
ncbi:hypothetical protein [Nonomuraea typhae]|uniref:Uncharacterized protein n=1 Tax=Nonomuraea typhae TaxID=2603600 RepID=A0ABW7YLT3_9ACTN